VKSPPTRGVKQSLKLEIYKLSKPSCPSGHAGRRRTFCIMGQRLGLTSKLKPLGVGVAKASVNSAIEFVGSDPKPSDLAMCRLKVR
jgi:hypothetical protein